MRKLLTLLVFGLSLAASAGDLAWETDFEKAKAQAAKENKTILINFTGSDWCGWCKKLDREVFTKDEFSAFADDSLVLVKIDFPRFTKLPEAQEKSNWALYEKYGVEGFPAIFLVDPNGTVKLRTGYMRGGPETYIKHLKVKI